MTMYVCACINLSSLTNRRPAPLPLEAGNNQNRVVNRISQSGMIESVIASSALS